MNTVGLVSCVARKTSIRTAAEELYQSPLFDGLSLFARTRTDTWFILSAKYGLLTPRQQVDPYDMTLIGKEKSERAKWARRVFNQLKNELTAGDRVVFLAGQAYREHLEPILNECGIGTAAPLSHLGIGRQVSWLRRLSSERTRIDDLDRLYASLGRLAAGLGGFRRLGECTAKTKWPDRGVYFFFEPSEFRTLAPFSLRVVRVGTHAVSKGSTSSIWGRLRTHRGGADGSGNHRGSIFRLHVGNALLNRAALSDAFLTWGIGQSASSEIRVEETPVEYEVSDAIGQMSVLFLNVPDEPGPNSDRSYLERNIVAMLAGPTGPLDLPSSEWLGQHSVHPAVRQSGLWNVNYVGETYDREVLNVLDQYVDVTIGKAPVPSQPIAREDWWNQSKRSTLELKQRQLL